MLISKRYSVVIPLYNKANDIEKTLSCVVKQTLAADEIIVVDDGSSDGGAERVEALNIPQLKLIRQANQGVSAARNRGVVEAQGRYVVFLDADDLWLPQFLEKIDSLAHQFPNSKGLATAYQYLNSDGKYTAAKIRLTSPYLNGTIRDDGLLASYFKAAAYGDLPFNASSIAIEKAHFLAIGGFPIGETMGEDQDLWARLALSTDIAYSPMALSVYNIAADNRACVESFPSQECSFSKRLYKLSQTCKNPVLADDIVQYTAAHLRQLLRVNTRLKRFDIARTLLGESRLKTNYAKYLVSHLELSARESLHDLQLASKNFLRLCEHVFEPFTSNAASIHSEKVSALRARRRQSRI